MRWIISGIAAAFVGSFTLSPAMAISCGPGVPGVNIELTGVAGAQCGSYGNGNLVIPAGFNTAVPLTWSFTDVILPGDANIIRTDGNFSFIAPSGYAQFVLGFQLDKDNPKPDWFTFLLPAASASGQFDSDYFFNITLFHHTTTVELFSDKIKSIVLYGEACSEAAPCEVGVASTTPLPAAVWLLGSVLAGGAGFGRWRKRRALKLASATA